MKSSRGIRFSSSDENAIRNESEENGFDVESIIKQCRYVTVCLHDEKLWRQFAKCDTEMIINRGGRYIVYLSSIRYFIFQPTMINLYVTLLSTVTFSKVDRQA